MSAATTRVRGLAPWHPQRSTVELLDAIRTVLLEYAAYLPLTVRQIFYRLVGAHGYAKTENAYSRLGEHLNRARRAGLIGFDAIRDDGVTMIEPNAWDDAEHLVASFLRAECFRLDRQRGQPAVLMFAVEAGGMVPQVQHIADRFGIAVHSSGGFDSLTANTTQRNASASMPLSRCYTSAITTPAASTCFPQCRKMSGPSPTISGSVPTSGFHGLAVTPAQITSMDLVTAPPKPTDKRSFSGETVQCEAIPPDALARIIQDAIESWLDRDAYDLVLAAEEVARTQLSTRLRPLLRGWEQPS